MLCSGAGARPVRRDYKPAGVERGRRFAASLRRALGLAVRGVRGRRAFCRIRSAGGHVALLTALGAQPSQRSPLPGLRRGGRSL